MPKCPYCKLSFSSGEPRSNRQNRYLWGVVYKLISDEVGHSPEEIHEILKDKFLPKHKIEIGNLKEEVPVSTKELTTADFNEYIETIQRFAAEQLSIVIPDPQ